jgi:hypothetical protein
VEKATGLNHDHSGSAAIRMAIGQPEELRRRFGLLGHASSISRKVNRRKSRFLLRYWTSKRQLEDRVNRRESRRDGKEREPSI